jgi:hypothetical protein
MNNGMTNLLPLAPIVKQVPAKQATRKGQKTMG